MKATWRHSWIRLRGSPANSPTPQKAGDKPANPGAGQFFQICLVAHRLLSYLKAPSAARVPCSLDTPGELARGQRG